MKRRDFLKTLPIIAGAPLALAPTSPFPQTVNGRHLIALGTSACILASTHAGELSFDSFTFINSKEPQSLRKGDTFISFQTPDFIFEQVENLRIPKSGHLPVLPLGQEIQNHLSGLTGELVFLAGLGGVTATLLFQSIGCHYTNSSQRLEWLAMMPFEFEGTRRELRSQLAIRVLADQRRELTCLYLEEIRSRYGNQLIRSAYEKADEWVVSELNEI